MNADDSLPTQALMLPHPKKGISVLFWTGIVLAAAGIASICAAEAFMADNPQGQQGVLAFYRAFGPFALAWTVIAACAHGYLRTHRNGNCSAQ